MGAVLWLRKGWQMVCRDGSRAEGETGAGEISSMRVVSAVVTYQMSLLLHYSNAINYNNCKLLYLYIHIPLSFTNLSLARTKKKKPCLSKASSDCLISNISNMRGVKITLEHVK